MTKTILVTGASSGFGRRISETLAASGHTVVATMRATETKNLEHARSLRDAGLYVVDLDVTDTRSVEAAVSHVIENIGKIDVVVNNAGVASRRQIGWTIPPFCQSMKNVLRFDLEDTIVWHRLDPV